MLDHNPRSWFAVQVMPRHEKKVAAMLAYKGCTNFLPCRKVSNRWSDRTKVIEQPLFPNYVFCLVGNEEFRVVLDVPGVYRFVGFGGKPYPVADQEIHALQKIAGSGLNAMPITSLKPGQKVRVVHGPLEGITGELTQIKNQNCLVVSVQMIMRSVAVTMEMWMVAKADDSAGIGQVN